MSKNCLNCDLARYTSHEGKVGCAYWSAIYHEELGNGSKTEVDKNYEMYKSGLRVVWTGWVFLKRRPEKKESEYLGEGMMTNFCVIVDENACCTKHKDK